MFRACFAVVMVCGLALGAGAQAPAQNKQITDTAEYNAYVAALGEQAPARKIQLLDEFLAKYPNTVVKEDALEVKLVAQQQAGQPFEATARQVLQVNPKNFRALLVLSFVFAQTGVNPQDPQLAQKLSEAEELAKRGVDQVATLPKPENISDPDFQKSKNVAGATFQQVLGIVALNRKDYPAAQVALRLSGELNPENAPVFYSLGDAYIRERPLKAAECFWAFARAIGVEGPNALSPAGKQQVDDYLKKVYTQYHGSEEGLDQIKQDAKASPFPPAGFKVMSRSEIEAAKPAPPPPPKPTNPESMTFGQMKEVLAGGGAPAKELWAKLNGMTLGLGGQVVSALPASAPRTVRLALLPETADQKGFFDLVLTLVKPVRPLAAGKKIQFEGRVNSFKEVPFSLNLVDGKITTPEAPAPAKKRPAAKKKR